MYQRLLPLACVAALLSNPLAAAEPGETIVRARVIQVNPSASSGDLESAVNGTIPDSSVAISDAVTLSIDMSYRISDSMAIEVALPLPTKYDINSEGAGLAALAPGKLGEVQMIPSTVMLQFHLSPEAAIRPYLGIGFNYTYFFSTYISETMYNGFYGASALTFENSYGFAAQAGLDLAIGEDWFLNLDIKYLDISSTMSFGSGNNGIVHTDVTIDPWIMGIGIGKRF
jgi:outer membrane protein